MLKFLQSPSFRTRLKVSIFILILIITGFLTSDAIGIRALYWFAVTMAAAELITTIGISMLPPFILKLKNFGFSFTGVYIWIFASMVSAAIIDHLPPKVLLLCLITSYGADALAYLIGSLIGGKFSKTHPFPTISPRKSWEGLFAGALGVMPIVYLVNTLMPSASIIEQDACQVFMLGGLIGSLGDLSESWLKRQMCLHDSNDIVMELPVFSFFENWLGGRNGHGGYADRIDSLLAVVVICGGYYLHATSLS